MGSELGPKRLRVGMSTGGIWRVYYIGLHHKLSVAWWALSRQLLVARHIKVVVPGVRADDLASPDIRIDYLSII